MTGNVIRLQPEAADAVTAAEKAVAVLGRHLDRCKLADRTVRAYKRQAGTYAAWLAASKKKFAALDDPNIRVAAK